ncbi:MAG: Lon protease [Candidatus Hydrogenedentota bacterium]
MASRSRANNATDKLPLLPLKDVVVFPRMVVPLLVGRPASLTSVEESLASGRPLFLCTQRDNKVETPALDDLYSIGVAANILQTLRMPDGTMKVVVEGMGRGRVSRIKTESGVALATVERVGFESDGPPDGECSALMRASLDQFEQYVRQSGRISPEVIASLRGVESPDAMADLVAAYMPLKVEERQELLETLDIKARLERLSSLLMRETDLLEIEHRVRERIRDQMDRSQREYYLHEQLKAIHQELGNRDYASDEVTELREMIAKAKMPKDVNEKAMRELARFEKMPGMSPEGAVIRTYLEWLVDMPWNKRSKDHLVLDEVRKALDEDHYGLPKVKERILEYMAVRKLSKSAKGPILCLVGPPGVGKTSLGRSIARAMGRQFVRVSLGGVRDEAEIRGHRRTYIGALPGRVIQSFRKVGVKNPVFMLDEIDKMTMDFRGDPSSALLEVLDPEQNTTFSDHYLEVDFDLSEVFFITTANTEYDIPDPLLDRLETVRLSGYTSYEKAKIAESFLVPKQVKENGLKPNEVSFLPDGVQLLIQRYTREAGVRELERQIAKVCRKVAHKKVAEGHKKAVKIDRDRVIALLGPEEYPDIRAEAKPQAGLAIGLAWTWAGGEILSIESTTTRGKGNITLTGQLGDVMKESAQAAYTFLRSNAKALGVPQNFHNVMDLHIHVPEGAIPKDGPSAGVALTTSLMSALTNRPPQGMLAMTGEITLRGRVLPVGGVKEKILAAHRAGIKTVILPKENEKDLRDVPKEVLDDIRIVPVTEVMEALRIAFDTRPRMASKAKSAKAKGKTRSVKRRARGGKR